MKTGNVANAANTQAFYQQYQNKIKPWKNDNNSGLESLLNPVDKYTPSSLEGVADAGAVKKLWAETDHASAAVRKLVSSSMGKNDAGGQGFWAVRAHPNFKLSDVDKAQAQEMVGEDGFFGVKKTAARIMDFAKALVGEGASEEKIEKMRAAVQKGFDAVSRMFGGYDNLPSVTKDTYDSIMKSFDSWKGGGTETAESES